mmetsp:Transcript_6836/g.17153  ORF Transcript_6836/g.17153 Transcript_6836/m.17153 type:complete len:219 (-) Transcript_6836:234-890(-)
MIRVCAACSSFWRTSTSLDTTGVGAADCFCADFAGSDWGAFEDDATASVSGTSFCASVTLPFSISFGLSLTVSVADAEVVLAAGGASAVLMLEALSFSMTVLVPTDSSGGIGVDCSFFCPTFFSPSLSSEGSGDGEPAEGSSCCTGGNGTVCAESLVVESFPGFALADGLVAVGCSSFGNSGLVSGFFDAATAPVLVAAVVSVVVSAWFSFGCDGVRF